MKGEGEITDLVPIPLPGSSLEDKARYVSRVISETHMKFWIKEIIGDITESDLEFLVGEIDVWLKNRKV